MQVPKLKVLVAAGVVREVMAIHQADLEGWTVRVTYATRSGERRETLERQRGGARAFTTLDNGGAVSGRAGARCVPG